MRVLRSSIIAASLLVGAAAHAGEYKLAPGDVLDFAVAGSPDLRKSVPIDPDGTISLPLVGEVAAGGRTLADLRGELRSLIGQKEVAQRAPGSPRGATFVIWPDQVSLTVSEFRPVYLNGDVAKPGEQKFKPGLTIRQALSMAGGYDILRFRMDNPYIESSQLRGDYETAWIDYAREQARLARVQRELGPDSPLASTTTLSPPLSAELLGRIRGTEASLLKTRTDDYERKKVHYRNLLAQQDTDVATLERERTVEVGAAQRDEDELNRVAGLNKLGTLPITRVVDERRLSLFSASRALQTGVALERAKTEREMTRRQAESVDADRRKDLLTEAQDTQTKLESIRNRIQAIGDKLSYVGALRTQLARGWSESPKLMLFRSGAPASDATEETELQPGDVVEVSLRTDLGAAPVKPTAMR